MVEKLAELVTEVQAAADKVATLAQEMSTTAQQMSQDAIEQAAGQRRRDLVQHGRNGLQ